MSQPCCRRGTHLTTPMHQGLYLLIMTPAMREGEGEEGYEAYLVSNSSTDALCNTDV